VRVGWTTMEDELELTLRARGHRVTQPRRAVWAVLQEAGGHLTVEDIVDRVQANGSSPDTASVYRTLALFEELGLARMSRLGDTDAGRWELAHPDEHFHLVCEVCGDVDHHVGSLVAQIREHLQEGHGFEPREVELTVTGRCTRCQERAP
jgi:Fur family transcriptional regulator, ferric uptake regulator